MKTDKEKLLEAMRLLADAAKTLIKCQEQMQEMQDTLVNMGNAMSEVLDEARNLSLENVDLKAKLGIDATDMLIRAKSLDTRIRAIMKFKE